MRKLQYIIVALVFVIGLLLGAGLMILRGVNCQTGQSTESIVSMETTIDTLCDVSPVAVDSGIVRYETRRLAIVGDELAEHKQTCDEFSCGSEVADSVDVVVPIEQKEYGDSTYRAWVSGFNVKLDSIQTYTRHDVTTIMRGEVKPKRWHIGLSGGYAMTPKGVQPYIGVSLTYSLISF